MPIAVATIRSSNPLSAVEEGGGVAGQFIRRILATGVERTNLMSPFAVLAGLATGIVLGLLGSGGAVLTVPALVYLLGVAPKSAIAMSLGIVGITAAIAGVAHWRRDNVDLPVAAGFAGFGMIGTYVGTRIGIGLPAAAQLVVFALVMYGAALRMLRRGADDVPPAASGRFAVRAGRVAALGTGLGVLTGVIGVGGGFLIVPALVLFAGLSMQEAIGTSLVVVTTNAATGFVGYLGTVGIDWQLFVTFTAIAVVGSFFGAAISRRLSAQRLRTGFAWFLVITATYMVWREVWHP
jgi:uncharacterized membrane protein YfcA